MPFQVDATELRRLAADIADLGRQADQARAYAHQHLTISAGEGNIFANVVAEAASLQQVLDANYARMAAALGGTGVELDRTVVAYEATDDAGSAALDATYQPHPR